MVEGGGSKEWSKARRMLRAEPALAEDLLDRITEATIVYLNAQVAAGAQVLQLFDSWAGALDAALFERYSMPRLRRICEEVTWVRRSSSLPKALAGSLIRLASLCLVLRSV